MDYGKYLKMRRINKYVLLVPLSLVLVLGCKKEETVDEKERVSGSTLKINKFIETSMKDIYLWYDEMPDVDINYEEDPEAYFYKLLYEDDKWSYITNDIGSFENSLEGVETSYGYSLAFGLFSNTEDVFAIVEYVYEGTPASKAGLKRGDIIIQMDGGAITKDNYTDLLYASSITITLGELDGNTIYAKEPTVSMVAEELTLNPVLIKKVIGYGGHKVGYLFYAQYISDFTPSLDEAFQYFQSEGITDLIIDLRYNPGGQIYAAQYLCSSVAPVGTVNNNSTLVTLQWNDKYQDYFEQNRNLYSGYTEALFTDTVAVKLGLDELYILTGSGTASASELTITGLSPYMNVTTVGDTTYGKYTASITVKPEDMYTDESYYSDFDNWGLQPIVLRYANSEGVTDFKDGFVPDILVDDDLWSGIPLGDIEDPLVKAALADMAGTEVAAIKSAKKTTPAGFTIFDRGFSKFDANKRELINDKFDKRFLNK